MSSRTAGGTDVLDIMEALLKAQLKAVDGLRRQKDSSSESALPDVATTGKHKRKSQTDMAYEVLLSAGQPLHALEIVQRIQSAFGSSVVRDSLVSAMLKRVAAGKQFTKTGKNTYGLLGRDSS